MAEILGPKYVGRKAEKYDAVRIEQKKWHEENGLIEVMLADKKAGTKVLDVPVGTGRFLKFYDKKKFDVIGIDSSDAMLAKARLLRTKASLELGDASSLPYEAKVFDTVVCVRLLHLVDETNLKKIFKEVTRLAKTTIILTIQMNKSYSTGLEVAVHDEKKFRAMIKAAGFSVSTEHRITGAGWFVMRLDR